MARFDADQVEWMHERAYAFDVERGMLGDRLVDPVEVLCDGTVCDRFAPDGAPLYFDRNHLTRRGSLAIVPQLERALLALL